MLYDKRCKEMANVVETQSEVITFSLGNHMIALPLNFVETIRMVEKIIPIPRAPKFVLGVTNIEDSIVPLVDLEELLKFEKRKGEYLISIILTLDDTLFGLAVNSLPKTMKVYDLSEVADESKLDIPFPDDWIEKIYEDKQKLVHYLLDPKEFWINLGDNSIYGPSVDYDIEKKEKAEKKEPKKEEPKKEKAKKKAPKKKKTTKKKQAKEEPEPEKTDEEKPEKEESKEEKED